MDDYGLLITALIALLAGLTWFEARTRGPAPVPWQVPGQLPALGAGVHASAIDASAVAGLRRKLDLMAPRLTANSDRRQ